MDIRIKLPSAIEGEWKIDEEAGEIVITPRFFKGKQTQAIAYATISNQHGAEKKAVISVQGKDGELRAENIKPPQYTAPAFDKVKPDDGKSNGNTQDPAVSATDSGGQGSQQPQRVESDTGVSAGAKSE